MHLRQILLLVKLDQTVRVGVSISERSFDAVLQLSLATSNIPVLLELATSSFVVPWCFYYAIDISTRIGAGRATPARTGRSTTSAGKHAANNTRIFEYGCGVWQGAWPGTLNALSAQLEHLKWLPAAPVHRLCALSPAAMTIYVRKVTQVQSSCSSSVTSAVTNIRLSVNRD